MTPIKLIVDDTSDLLPVICICQSCKKQWSVDAISDFRHKTLSSGMDAEKSDEIFIKCPACKDNAFPPAKLKDRLIKAFEEWKYLNPNAIQFEPMELFCQRSMTRFRVDDVKQLELWIASDGPIVAVRCPDCDSVVRVSLDDQEKYRPMFAKEIAEYDQKYR